MYKKEITKNDKENILFVYEEFVPENESISAWTWQDLSSVTSCLLWYNTRGNGINSRDQ